VYSVGTNPKFVAVADVGNGFADLQAVYRLGVVRLRLLDRLEKPEPRKVFQPHNLRDDGQRRFVE
jgi:hypothetical protein